MASDTEGPPRWAERLRAERRARLWSKKEMAVRLLAAAGPAAAHLASRDGLIRMIGYWEKGDRQVNDRYRTLFCRVLELPEPELFAESPTSATPGITAPVRAAPVSAAPVPAAPVSAGHGDVTAGAVAHDTAMPGAATPGAPVPGAWPQALAREASLVDTLELARRAGASDLCPGTVESITESVDLLCRAYPTTPGPVLLERTRRRLGQVVELLGKRVSLAQHRELLVQAGWLSALLGCVHYDLGQVEDAGAARQAAFQMGREAGHDELRAWSLEMAAWFALVEGRYEAVVEWAWAGQEVAGTGSALVQLTLQEAKGHARLGDRRRALEALSRGATILAKLPRPPHPEHHFVFDHDKWVFYAATVHAWLGDDEVAERHAEAIIAGHLRPDGSSRAPMRVANARMDLALVHARRGDLDAAVAEGTSAFGYERRSIADLVARGGELSATLQSLFPGEPLVADFQDHLTEARRALAS